MSFTPDEIQAFNDILEKKLAAHRREMERGLEQRLQTLRREFEQRLNALQQELVRVLAQELGDQQRSLQNVLSQKLNAQQISLAQAVSQEVRQRQQQQQPQLEGLIDRALAAQLLAIEELLNQRLTLQSSEDTAMPMGEHAPQFETIEVQTELPWEDLIDIFGKALDERFVALNETMQSAMRNLEQYFAIQVRTMQMQFQEKSLHNLQPQPYTDDHPTNMQEIFQSIAQLERNLEAMQVAMAANHAMLSNRLYHHQQLSMERAHNNNPSMPPPTSPPPARLGHPNGMSGNSPLPLNKEHSGQ
jgi:hypothetical protein